MEIKPFFKTNASLQNGMYCGVTREQAIELFDIEDGLVYPHNYVNSMMGSIPEIYVLETNVGLVLSVIKHGDMTQQLQFPDFKERLVNTVKTSNLKTNI